MFEVFSALYSTICLCAYKEWVKYRPVTPGPLEGKLANACLTHDELSTRASLSCSPQAPHPHSPSDINKLGAFLRGQQRSVLSQSNIKLLS